MNQSDTSHLETDPPRDRLSRLSEASLRINETLEFDKVLQVVDSARAMTGARYGMMAKLNESGGAENFLSSGTTAEEHRQLEEPPGTFCSSSTLGGSPSRCGSPTSAATWGQLA